MEKDETILLDLPYHKLESVLLFGNVQVTAAAMTELLDKGVRMSVFTRHGRFRGSLAPPQGRNIERRIAQFELFRDAARSLDIARVTVAAKLRNANTVLKRYARRNPETPSPEAECATIEQCLARLDQAAAVAELDGMEGAAAQAYFTALMRYNRSLFQWPGRKRHPSEDPLNALLSFTYMLLCGELEGLLEGVALDLSRSVPPADYGRPSLALDPVEAFRHPVADRFVLTQVNRDVPGCGFREASQ